MGIGHTAIIACLALVVVATVTDVVSRKIPNTLTLGGIVVGLGLHAATGFVDGGASGALHGFGRALVGIAVCGIIPVLSFARREMGGGDVKLFAAIGALCGPVLGFDVQACAFLVLMVVVTPWRLLRHGALRVGLRNAVTVASNLFRTKEHKQACVPLKMAPVIMGPSILAGVCLALVRHGFLR
jgi:prepilin peptidase CpaA